MIGLNMITKIFLALALTFNFIVLGFTPLAHAACGTDVSTKDAIQCGAGEASGNNETPDNAAGKANSTIAKMLKLC
jgi:hypothetical protein